MKGLMYRSVDHVLEEVRAMRVRGGSAFGQAAAVAFHHVARDEAVESTDALFARLDAVANDLLREKPTMATIHNARELIVERVRSAAGTGELYSVRDMVAARAERFVNVSSGALERLGEVGANHLQDGQTIMMHSFSESVMAIFAAARLLRKRFNVICTESRPLREGRFSASRLSEMGVQVTFVTDAAMAEVVPLADWVVVGADSVGFDGSVANKMGTNLLSILAERFNVPLYVATEILKLQPLTRRGIPILLEQRDGSEVVDSGDFGNSENVIVRNQFFDLTPARRITAIISQQGLYAPGQIAQAWDEWCRDFEQGL